MPSAGGGWDEQEHQTPPQREKPNQHQLWREIRTKKKSPKGRGSPTRAERKNQGGTVNPFCEEMKKREKIREVNP